MIFICITFSNQTVFAQTAEVTPARSSIDDILRAGTSYGNKTYEGLLGYKEETAEQRDIVSIARFGISHICGVKNLFGKHRFSLALQSSDRLNFPNEQLAIVMLSLNLQDGMEAIIQKDLTESNDSRLVTDLFIFSESELKFDFDANCKVGTRTEIRALEPKKTIPIPNTPSTILERALSSVFFKSVMHINFDQLNIQSGNQKSGLAEFSNFCVDIFGANVTPKKMCTSEKITMYCQDDDCYIQPLEYLVEKSKITSQGQPEPFKSQVLNLERQIEERKKTESAKSLQIQG